MRNEDNRCSSNLKITAMLCSLLQLSAIKILKVSQYLDSFRPPVISKVILQNQERVLGSGRVITIRVAKAGKSWRLKPMDIPKVFLPCPVFDVSRGFLYCYQII